MLDVTADIEEPVNLTFDKKLLSGQDLSKLCGVDKLVANPIQANSDAEMKCYRKENGNYYFTDICEFDKSKDFRFLYSQIITKFHENDLLKTLPQNDTTYSTASTPKITYNLRKEEIIINIISEGGESRYRIYRKKDKSIIEVTKTID